MLSINGNVTISHEGKLFAHAHAMFSYIDENDKIALIGGHLKKAPSRLLLVFGDTWPDEQWVMRSCNITRQRFDKELNCIFAEASIELAEYIDQSRDANEVRG